MKDPKRDSIARKDWKYMEQLPYGDPDFSEEHNKRVIAEVDAWNDEQDRKRSRDFSEKTLERTSAVAQYLKSVSEGAESSTDKYFGKRYLAYLRGQEIVKKLKENPALIEKMKNKWKGKGVLSPL